MLRLQHKKLGTLQEPVYDRNGWNIFSEEMAFFLVDFSKYELNAYEKLIFFGYYVMGFTLEELAERLHCSFQNIAVRIKKINTKLKYCWEFKEEWKVPDA